MAHSTRRSGGTRGFLCIFALSLGGCASLPGATADQVRTKSKTELAIEAISASMLKECERLPADAPENSVGNMADELVVTYRLLATCADAHDALVRYLRPVVEAEKQPKPR